MKTENQIRAWLKTKLENYIYKIKGENSYGSRKRLQTIAKDLEWILDEFKKQMKEGDHENKL